MSKAKKIGLVGCIGLVVANMMGSGIALLPAQLAAFGGISIVSWIITLVGAICLAFVFAELGAQDETVGGPPAYAKEVSRVFGFQSGVIYYIANWVGNIAIGITGISYLSNYIPALKNPLTGSIVLIAIIWILTGVNLLGGKWVSKVATAGVALMLIPILITAVGGWFLFSAETYKANWTVAASGSSTGSPVLQGVLLCLWAFIGIESASVSGTNVEKPKRTVPLATMIGVAFAGLVYIASSQVMLGMFPAAELASSTAPFGLSMTKMIGQWAAVYTSVATTITCFTCLSAWMLLVGESAQTSAEMGDFPKLFKAEAKSGVPRKGLLVTSVFMSVVLLAFGLLRRGGDGMGEIFNDVVNIAVLMTMIPYIYSAMNLIRFGEEKAKGFLVIAAAVVASVFCMIAILGGGAMSIAGTFVVSLIFLLFFARKEGKEQRAEETAPKNNQ
jgi:cadaverine:lysine antiporter